VFVRQAGAGRPLVLLHGLLVSGEMFDPLLPVWSARHRLIVPDLRGHGRSAGLPGPYRVERLAADVADLLDGMNVARADVLGYSQGGTVA
jgi:3-oxoadipate enol-lactonase